MEKALLAINSYFAQNRRVFYLVFGAVFAVITFFGLRVKFEEDISKIIPRDKTTDKLNEIFENSKFIDKLVIMVSLKDSTVAQPDSLTAFADRFGEVVQSKLHKYIRKVNFKIDDELALQLFQTIGQDIPIYLNEKDYATIDSLTAPGTINSTLQNDIRTLSSPAGIALKKIIINDPTGITMIGLRKLQQLQYDKNFELYDDYVVTKDHKNLVLFITPAYPPNNTGENIPFLHQLDDVINGLTSTDYKYINASYFGAVAGFASNASQLRQDTNVTLAITIVVLVLFLALYFRKASAPVIILIPVLFGGMFALAAIYFITGTLSVIALGTGSVVLGIAVNYSLHVFNHYRHTKSVEQVIKDLAQPLTIGSFTTIGGFFCLEFVQSEMLKDLGLFAGFSLIGASFCSLVFLPQFITTKKEERHHQIIQFSWIDKMASYNPEYNKYIIAGILALTVVFYYTTNWVGFESDISGMNYLTPKLKVSEARLNRINRFALQSVYLVTEGKTLDQALANNERLARNIDSLKEKKVVVKYSGVASLIISDSLQKARIDRWNKYWTPEKKQKLLATLEQQGVPIGFRPTAFENFKALLNKTYVVSDQHNMAEVRKTFLDDFITEKPGHATVVTLVQTTPDHKKEVYNAFANNNDVTVVDKQYLANKLVSVINSDFTQIAIMTSLLVLITLWLTYGRIEMTLVSFIPMFVSWIWIIGIMGIFGINFNIINIIISALIFGLGDDYSLYIMDGLLQEYKTGKRVLSSYKTSIFLSAITTLVGLGVLVFARHPALKSIAFISIIGIGCVVIMSQILIPFLFNILVKNRTSKKQFPWTFFGFLKSVFAFAYFVTGCIILTILGWLFKLSPFGRERTKLVYHFILSIFARSLIYIMINVKKQIIGRENANFAKPAVIIANHQSFLDILSLVMLSPRMVFLTKDWVWKSPVFGAVARMADFYPVAEGAEEGIEFLAGRVKHGYSIVVFPEGTRSITGEVKRFHKGAFYLAEALNIDIQPIVIHGTGYTMTKGDFLLKDGKITLEYLPRIAQRDNRFGAGYAEKTKQVSRYFKQEFKRLSIETEKPRYYKEQLIYNYLYKGPIFEWRLRLRLLLEKSYAGLNALLPLKGKILHLGCGEGVVSYLMHFVSEERIFTGVDNDEDKIEIAGSCFSKDDGINFVCAGALDFDFEKYDAIVLSGILSALEPLAQQRLIEKCINNLEPGGSVIIIVNNKKIMPKRPRSLWVKFIAGQVFNFSNRSETVSSELIEKTAATAGMKSTIANGPKYSADVVYLIKRELEN
jgi:1-acyl-sn-glycerol-3-phosphate acyltransferase